MSNVKENLQLFESTMEKFKRILGVPKQYCHILEVNQKKIEANLISFF